jgi:hypothetical protein
LAACETFPASDDMSPPRFVTPNASGLPSISPALPISWLVSSLPTSSLQVEIQQYKHHQIYPRKHVVNHSITNLINIRPCIRRRAFPPERSCICRTHFKPRPRKSKKTPRPPTRPRSNSRRKISPNRATPRGSARRNHIFKSATSRHKRNMSRQSPGVA